MIEQFPYKCSQNSDVLFCADSSMPSSMVIATTGTSVNIIFSSCIWFAFCVGFISDFVELEADDEVFNLYRSVFSDCTCLYSDNSFSSSAISISFDSALRVKSSICDMYPARSLLEIVTRTLPDETFAVCCCFCFGVLSLFTASVTVISPRISVHHFIFFHLWLCILDLDVRKWSYSFRHGLFSFYGGI